MQAAAWVLIGDEPGWARLGSVQPYTERICLSSPAPPTCPTALTRTPCPYTSRQAHDELVSCLSALQLESVVYACQRHQQLLPDGSRGGFFIGGLCAGSACSAQAQRSGTACSVPSSSAFLEPSHTPSVNLTLPPLAHVKPSLPAGDGAGVGKGRTIAGLILENWRRGRRKHLWVSVGTDLKIDTQRDLTDVGGELTRRRGEGRGRAPWMHASGWLS